MLKLSGYDIHAQLSTGTHSQIFRARRCAVVSGGSVARDIQPGDIRNLVLLGHNGVGKTSVAEGILFAVGAASFDHTDKLSPAVESALPGVIEQVQTLCRAKPGADGISSYVQ